ncbi:MAG: hydroxymethylbilane synthase [Anaerolineae bacterium]
MTDPEVIRIGTRGSALARWQADHVADLLRQAYPGLQVEIIVFTTRGDQILDTPLPLIGGKGVFTAELESALHAGTVDIAVHSLKDLPTENPEGLVIGAVPARAPVEDALVSKDGLSLDDLPAGAVIGTSSSRRGAQLRYYRPDLQLRDIRGNVPTRINKVMAQDGTYTATLLARAGLERLGRADAITQILPLTVMLPAPGQGALGIQCRDEPRILDLLAPIEDRPTRLAVEAERAFLAALGGGCAVPIAAHAGLADDGMLALTGRVTAHDGTRQIEVNVQGAMMDENASVDAARALGREAARQALQQGAAQILENGQ